VALRSLSLSQEARKDFEERLQEAQAAAAAAEAEKVLMVAAAHAMAAAAAAAAEAAAAAAQTEALTQLAKALEMAFSARRSRRHRGGCCGGAGGGFRRSVRRPRRVARPSIPERSQARLRHQQSRESRF
jgi:hypothetical protein